MQTPKKLSFHEYLFGKVCRFIDRYVWRYSLNRKLRKYFLNKKQEGDWWEKEYFHQFHHHSFQNKVISLDFIKHIQKNYYFQNLFSTSHSFVELGSGTGELSFFLGAKYSFQKINGFEVSQTAVGIANHLYANSKLHFTSITTDDQLDTYGKFDFIICSNTLEHFKDPFPIIEKAFHLSDILIVIVPYNQPLSSQYEYEGGPDHVFCFNEETFHDYTILGGFIFRTGGWQESSEGEEPLEMAIAISKKLPR